MLTETTSTTEIYINPQIIAIGSERMLEKLKEGEALFFTVSIEQFKALLSKGVKKDRGHRFGNCEPYYIPNSYFEIHVEDNISILSDKVSIQFRRRKDDRGINIFVCKSENEISHCLSFEKYPDKDEYFNEIHFKSKMYSEDLYISISLN